MVERVRGVHKARPDDEMPTDVDVVGWWCAVCGWRIRKVPGGSGPTWVHSATGTVAGGGADPERSET